MATDLTLPPNHSFARCERCGEAHSATECDKPIKCCNCGGDHLASSSACPVFRDIYTKVVVNNLM